MWNKIKKFLFEPSKVDKERVERWKDATDSDDKLTIEHFDKAVNPQDEIEEEVQVTKHMSVKKKKDKKSNPVNYNF